MTQNHSRRRDLIYLAALGLVVQIILAWPIRQPGIMDSHYYYGGGQSLLQNGAFVEPYIWNYLDNPPGLPAPSHLYWMPLPSMLVALAQALLGLSFRAAQVPFISLAASLPCISYLVSWTLGRNRRHALVAGLLALLSGFYAPYWSIPETFAPFAVVGGLTLYTLGRWLEERRRWWALGIGLLAGLGHLCRADGSLLLAVGLILAVLADRCRPRRAVATALAIIGGYLVVMGPWFVRNWQVMEGPLSSAGVKTLFLRSYDELFSYGTPLTWQRYLAWGWDAILRSKLQAGWTNLQTFVAVNNLVFLTPFCLIGFWQLRHRRLLWPAILFAGALYSAMTLLYTFPGARGGVFHSSAALLPSIYAASLVGLDAAIERAARWRRWNQPRAKRFFSLGVILLAAGLTLFTYSRRVVGSGTWSNPAWNGTDSSMERIGAWIQSDSSGEPIVMVGNPPAFVYHTGLAAIVIPNETVETTLQAALRYGATYIVLDQNRPEPLAALYAGAETHPQLELVWDAERGAPRSVTVFRIGPDLPNDSE